MSLLATSSRQLFRSSIRARCLSQDVKSKIDKAVKDKPVVLFMKGTPQMPQCGFSRAVVQILDLHDIPKNDVKAYNVLEDQELREAIKEYSSWPTIPQVYVDGEFIGGCDIVMEMHSKGELAKVFQHLKGPASDSVSTGSKQL